MRFNRQVKDFFFLKLSQSLKGQNKLFEYLEEIEGEKGAKSVITQLKHDVYVLPNSDAEMDIDTVEDFEKLKNILA